jgi:hypothetical protein
MFVKIQNLQLQIAVYDISLVWWGLLFGSIVYLFWLHCLMKADGVKDAVHSNTNESDNKVHPHAEE